MGCGSSSPSSAPQNKTIKSALKNENTSKTTASPAKPSRKPQAVAQVESEALKKKQVNKRVREVYKLSKTLGTGGFSVVKLAVHRETSEEYACKVMALPPPGAELDDYSNTREDILKEIEILCKLEHPNIIYLKEFYDEGNKVYLITELLTGGELLDALLARGSYTEEDARKSFEKLLSALEYLHREKVGFICCDPCAPPLSRNAEGPSQSHMICSHFRVQPWVS